MFRITTQKRDRTTCVTLDGRLEGSDIEEIRRAFSAVTGPAELRLSGLESCSEEVVQELRRRIEAGVRLASATPYLRMMLVAKSDAAQTSAPTKPTKNR